MRKQRSPHENPAYEMKDTHAIRNCVILTLIAAAFAVPALIFKWPVALIAGLLPAAVYEIIRTEGVSTRAASVVLTLVLLAEIVFILFNIRIDLAALSGVTGKTVGGYDLPLGDIRMVGTFVLAILAVVLFIRTAGAYTKWLAVVLFAGAFALIYLLSPSEFPKLLKWGLKEGSHVIRAIF